MNYIWKSVLATHEEAQPLAGGPWLGDTFPGVALPCHKARGRWIIVRFGDVWTCAQVADVGPWCTDDDDYVLGMCMPRAERLKGLPCPRTLADPDSRATLPGGHRVGPSNGAGIDLFPYTAHLLHLPIGENARVEWRFVDP